MDFDFNDEQREIKSTAREFLASRFKPERVRELAESDPPYGDEWDAICELGWPGIAIDEEYGGEGLGAVELIILQEELGYALAPSPLIANAYAGAVIQAAGSDEQKQKWLPGIASGKERGAAEMTCDPDPILGAAGGASILVLADGNGAKLVEPDDATLEKLDFIDTTRAYFRVTAEGGDPLPGDIASAGSVGQIALAAECVGVAQRALDMSVEYAKERQQFGRPIGAYQAVSHRLADMLWDVEEARSLTYYGGMGRRRRPGSPADRGFDGQGARLGRRDLGHPQRDPDAWRHRLHLGARHPLFLEARPSLGADDGNRPRSPRQRRDPRRPRLIPHALKGSATPDRSRHGLVVDRNVGGELRLAVERVLDVHLLVLLVRAEEAQVHREPAARRDLLLDDRAGEDDLAAACFPDLAARLLDTVDMDPDRLGGAARKAGSRAGGVAALRDVLGIAHRSAFLTASNGPF